MDIALSTMISSHQLVLKETHTHELEKSEKPLLFPNDRIEVKGDDEKLSNPSIL